MSILFCISRSKRGEPSFTLRVIWYLSLSPNLTSFRFRCRTSQSSLYRMGRVGLEPTVFLMWEIYSLLPSPLGIPTRIDCYYTKTAVGCQYPNPPFYRSKIVSQNDILQSFFLCYLFSYWDELSPPLLISLLRYSYLTCKFLYY